MSKAKQKEYIKSLEEQRDRVWNENERLKVENDNFRQFIINLIDGLHMINELAAALGHGEVAVVIEKGKDGKNKFIAVEAEPESENTDTEKEDGGE